MVMENSARLLNTQIEKFEKELGIYQFSAKGSTFTIQSAEFAGDRKGLLKFVQKKLSRFGAKFAMQNDTGPLGKPKIGSSIGGLIFQLPREGESPFEKYIIEAKELPGAGTTKVSTADQENYSALCVAAKLKDETTVYNFKDLEKHCGAVYTNGTPFNPKDVKDLYDNRVTMEWKESSKFQVDLLFKKVNFNMSYTIERQSQGPITKYIYSAAMKYIKDLAAGSQSFSIFKGLAPDKWNPGDIWIIDKTLSVDDFTGCKTLLSLNEKILSFFKKGRMYPVSLKQAKAPDPPFEISNDGEESFTSFYKNHNLGTAKKVSKGFNTLNNNMHIDFVTKNSKTKHKEAKVRPFTGKAISLEIEGEVAKGGKAGLTFLDKVLIPMGFKPVTNFNKLINKAKTDLNGSFLELFNMVLKLKDGNNKIYDGKTSRVFKKTEFDTFYNLIVNSVKNKPKDRGKMVAYFNAKYQAVEIAQRIEKMSSKQKDEFIDRAVTYASSTIKQVSSVFIKVGN